MFDLGWTELLIVGAVALIVIGPKELPGVLRMLGQWMAKIRRMAADFQGQFNEALREAEMADLKKQVDELADSARDLTSGLDPTESIEDAIGDPFDDKPKTTGKAKDDDNVAVAEAGAISIEGPTEPSAQPHTDPGPLPGPEPVPAVEEQVSPPDHTTTDADEAPPPQKAAAGGHPA